MNRETLIDAMPREWTTYAIRQHLADALLPAVERIADERAAEALEEAAKEFAARLPDGTGNGRAYNSYRVAAMLTDRAASLRAASRGETGQ